MTDGFDIKLNGSKELDKLLKVLPVQLARRVVRGALLKSAKPITNQAKKNLDRHKRTGKLKKGVKAKSLKRGRRNKRSEVAVAIGPTRDRFYGRFLELGTVNQKATPFLKPALDSKKNQQRKILVREVASRTHKEASKLVVKFRTRK